MFCLAAGATTVRDVGTDCSKAKEWRAQSASHKLVAPRILLYKRIWAAKGAHTADLVRQGCIADLLVVNGNPVENLRLLNPYGTDVLPYDGKAVNNYSPLIPGDAKIKVERGGGIEWTIKEGILYHVPTLMKEVKAMVEEAPPARAK
ncbi:MAG: hypothetical protein ACUVV5_08540 [Candidatus Aminicenantales bacterium]